MASVWPWLAVAGVGALHGLNPATGWMFAAAWGVRSRDRSQILRALLPIAVGHAASIAVVAAAVAVGVSIDRDWMIGVAVAGLVSVGFLHIRRRDSARTSLTLWSFAMSTFHGAGLMLVPALIPLCLASAPGRELTASGSLTLALAVVAVHMAAMLIVTGVIAACVRRGVELVAPRRRTTPGSSPRAHRVPHAPQLP